MKTKWTVLLGFIFQCSAVLAMSGYNSQSQQTVRRTDLLRKTGLSSVLPEVNQAARALLRNKIVPPPPPPPPPFVAASRNHPRDVASTAWRLLFGPRPLRPLPPVHDTDEPPIPAPAPGAGRHRER